MAGRFILKRPALLRYPLESFQAVFVLGEGGSVEPHFSGVNVNQCVGLLLLIFERRKPAIAGRKVIKLHAIHMPTSLLWTLLNSNEFLLRH